MRRFLTVIIGLSLMTCGGCAVFNRENTPALNFVEEHMVPKQTITQIATFPVVVPVGLVAGTIDMFILHPLSVTRDALEDTNELLWKKQDWDKHYVTNMAGAVLNVPRAVATPIVFTGDFLARSTLDISRRGGDIRTNKSSKNNQRQSAEEKQEI